MMSASAPTLISRLLFRLQISMNLCCCMEGPSRRNVQRALLSFPDTIPPPLLKPAPVFLDVTEKGLSWKAGLQLNFPPALPFSEGAEFKLSEFLTWTQILPKLYCQCTYEIKAIVLGIPKSVLWHTLPNKCWESHVDTFEPLASALNMP